MKLAIGIDTGGTYTDAVLYDFETKKILHAAKALTTKNDLCVGIGNALDALPDEHFKEVRMLSLSTTLATNACVEGKGGAAKLVFFNGDKDILKKYGAEYGLPPVGEILVEPCHTDISGQIDAYPDWEKFEADVRENCRGLDGIGVIELYSFKNGAVIEKEAKERIAKIADIPVTCGYELFREPNSLQRGAGTLLNAGLYPVIEDFLRAVRRAMQKRGIDSPLVIMRSDGSLMTEEFARKHPVETLLCGPAASVAGGYGLSREKNSVIVDMGGTTTDIAIVRGHGRQVAHLCGRNAHPHLRAGRRQRRALPRQKARLGGVPRGAAVRGLFALSRDEGAAFPPCRERRGGAYAVPLRVLLPRARAALA